MRIKLDLNIIKSELPKLLENIKKAPVNDTAISQIRTNINKMRTGWANEYSANLEFCLAIVESAIIRKPKNVLECGSGFTTILLAALAQELEFSFTALENSKEWYEITRRSLLFLGFSPNALKMTPLKNYNEFEWYAVEEENMNEVFDFIVCDGPPGHSLGGRRGLLPVLKKNLSENCIIFLDDAGREGEKEVLDYWEKEFGLIAEIKGATHPYAQILTSYV